MRKIIEKGGEEIIRKREEIKMKGPVGGSGRLSRIPSRSYKQSKVMNDQSLVDSSF